MNDQPQALELHEDIVASIVLDGDLSKLNPGQLVAYYYHRCDLLKIDPGEKPFDLLRLNGKLILYCTKAGASALTRVNRITVQIIDRDMLDGLCIHTARASLPCGRSVDDVGAVDLTGLKGEKLANAIMKSATKAKRRAVLGLCGQGLVDESELDGIPGRVERVSIADVEREATAQRALPPASTCSPEQSATVRRLRIAFAALVGKLPGEVWGAVCGKVAVPAIDGRAPEPEELTEALASAAAQLLEKWIVARSPKPEDNDPDDRPDERPDDAEEGWKP